jgi:electron transfer flavoprotein-quinone oxidoreductase
VTGLAGYRERLERSFVLADHRRFRDAPELVLSDRVQQRYPAMVAGMLGEMFTVANPRPKRGAVSIALGQMKKQDIRWRELVRDGWRILRTFG